MDSKDPSSPAAFTIGEVVAPIEAVQEAKERGLFLQINKTTTTKTDFTPTLSRRTHFQLLAELTAAPGVVLQQMKLHGIEMRFVGKPGK